jgi:oxalate decarboxylase/phosphoglucose isomerase-like protein (cupin superfamily)
VVVPGDRRARRLGGLPVGGRRVHERVRRRHRRQDAIVVPAGARHNVKNTGSGPLKLYTLYAPPEHADRTVHVTKADAEAAEEHFDGKTTE